MIAQRNAGKGFERSTVRGNHGSPGTASGGCDDQIVCPARLALLTHVEQELGVGRGNPGVVVEDWNGRRDRVEEVLSARLSGAGRQEDADLELGDRDGRYGDVVVIVICDQLLEHAR